MSAFNLFLWAEKDSDGTRPINLYQKGVISMLQTIRSKPNYETKDKLEYLRLCPGTDSE